MLIMVSPFRRMAGVAALFALLTGTPACLTHAAEAARAAGAKSAEPITPVPPASDGELGKVALGKRLFHDPRLSTDSSRSCATCHPLDRGGMDGKPRAITLRGAQHRRNTLTIFNVGLSSSFNWDGIADTLEAHAEIVLLSPDLMGNTWPALLGRLRTDQVYVTSFDALYPDGLTRASVLNALASFERSLRTPDSRFDRYLRGDAQALTAREKRGYDLFKSHGCVACHQGVNIGGNVYQKFGVFQPPDQESGRPVDLGRYRVTSAIRDREVFRVPSLRNVAVTGPYFHDGRAQTLHDAVETMARVQLGRELSEEEIGTIVRFLHTLTGEYQGKALSALDTGGR